MVLFHQNSESIVEVKMAVLLHPTTKGQSSFRAGTWERRHEVNLQIVITSAQELEQHRICYNCCGTVACR